MICYNKLSSKGGGEKMINIRTLRKLTDGQGLTLKGGKPITYKSGYQVADMGIETADITIAIKAIRQEYKGNCGVWLNNGIYYIDHSFRIATKRQALEIGQKHNQISILKWADMSLVYC